MIEKDGNNGSVGCVQISVGMNSWVLCNMKKVGILLVVIGIMSLSGCTGQTVDPINVDLDVVIQNPSAYTEGKYRITGYLEPVIVEHRSWSDDMIAGKLHTTPDINSPSMAIMFYTSSRTAMVLGAYVDEVIPESVTYILVTYRVYGVWTLRRA